MLKHFGIYKDTTEISEALQAGLLEEPYIVMTADNKLIYSINEKISVETTIDLGSVDHIDLIVNDMITLPAWYS